MSERYQVIPRTLCFIKNKDSYLFLRYSEKKGAMQGYYNCPGGHIEKTEGIIENAEKEILEETGIKVDDTRLKGILHIEGFFGKSIMLFITLSHTDTWDTIESEEGTIHWLKKEELEDIDLMEDVRSILGKIESMNDGEIFTGKSLFDGTGKLLSLDFE